MKSFKKVLLNRMALGLFFMLLQVASVYVLAALFRGWFLTFYCAWALIAVGVVIAILGSRSNAAYKTAWIVPVMALPVFGTLLYLMFGKNRLNRKRRRRMSVIEKSYGEALSGVCSKTKELSESHPDGGLQARYLERAARSPLYQGTETAFLAPGEVLFSKMLEALRKAEKFIFLEYFTVSPGVMWDALLKVLAEKAANGVDVRLLYDDVGSMTTLPANFGETVRARGIQCRVFQRFVPLLSGSFNNRDHRKICVVDGLVAFTGGVNLADEYINATKPYGHWLDCGLLLRGAAVRSFTAMFLSMWDYVSKSKEDFSKYAPAPEAVARIAGDGYVLPFSDAPTDDEPVGENAYINMIARARLYVYICTPYLIVGSELLTALCTAAKCGVDVRIITPGVGDKAYAHALTRSNYPPLVEAGVRIYEYTPGFIHSKTFVSDDLYAICGTINLDYRSLYLHYECAAWLCESNTVLQMRDHFTQTLAKCQEITPQWCEAVPRYQRLVQSLLRIFAPLM